MGLSKALSTHKYNSTRNIHFLFGQLKFIGSCSSFCFSGRFLLPFWFRHLLAVFLAAPFRPAVPPCDIISSVRYNGGSICESVAVSFLRSTTVLFKSWTSSLKVKVFLLVLLFEDRLSHIACITHFLYWPLLGILYFLASKLYPNVYLVFQFCFQFELLRYLWHKITFKVQFNSTFGVATGMFSTKSPWAMLQMSRGTRRVKPRCKWADPLPFPPGIHLDT